MYALKLAIYNIYMYMEISNMVFYTKATKIKSRFRTTFVFFVFLNWPKNQVSKLLWPKYARIEYMYFYYYINPCTDKWTYHFLQKLICNKDITPACVVFALELHIFTYWIMHIYTHYFTLRVKFSVRLTL